MAPFPLSAPRNLMGRSDAKNLVIGGGRKGEAHKEKEGACRLAPILLSVDLPLRICTDFIPHNVAVSITKVNKQLCYYILLFASHIRHSRQPSLYASSLDLPRINSPNTAIMNLGSFGKLSIVYAVLALFLIIELGLTGYSESSTLTFPR